MKRTIVKYRDFGSYIEVLGVENTCGYDSVKRGLGEKVSDRYLRGYPFYNPNGCCDGSETYFFPKASRTKCMSRVRFSKMISTMKAAGKRLQRIVEEEREKEVKEIVI